MSERRQRQAIHEAGHVLMASLFHLQPSFVTIEGDHPGVLISKPDRGLGSIATSFAGGVAESRWCQASGAQTKKASREW
jgi:hypothetical protein